MHNRYTIKELKEMSDYELLEAIVSERKSDCTNYYSPLYKRLSILCDKLRRKEKLTKGG